MPSRVGKYRAFLGDSNKGPECVVGILIKVFLFVNSFEVLGAAAVNVDMPPIEVKQIISDVS